MPVLDACPLCRSVLPGEVDSCPSCGAELAPYYELSRLSVRYIALARELLSRGEVDRAAELIGRLPQLATVEEHEQAELEARLALARRDFQHAMARAAACQPEVAEQILSEAALMLERRRSARENYNYALSAARQGSYSLGSDYMQRAVQSDPLDSELWKLKLKLDLKAGRFEQCYRDIAALDRLQARPPSFIHLEELLPPIGLRRRGAD